MLTGYQIINGKEYNFNTNGEQCYGWAYTNNGTNILIKMV